jgi:hypothetical protein
MYTIEHPITSEKIQIGLKDFSSVMTWDHAVKACSDFGNSWRLPTGIELQKMREEHDKIGGFKKDIYWSSTVLPNTGDIIIMCCVNFDFNYAPDYLLDTLYYASVRPVRSI